MSVWFEVELHTFGGVEVRSDITEEIAQEMLRSEWRYIWPTSDLTDRDKVARMLSTQIAMAVEKQSGMFVLDGVAGKSQKWLVPNAAIAAVLITDAEGKRVPGYGSLEILSRSEAQSESE